MVTHFKLSRAGVVIIETDVGSRCTILNCIPDTGIAETFAGDDPQIPSESSTYLIGHSNRKVPSDARWPFSHLQEAAFGDEIVLDTKTGTFTYSVGEIQQSPYSEYPTASMQKVLPYRLMAIACHFSPDGKTYLGVVTVDANLVSATLK